MFRLPPHVIRTLAVKFWNYGVLQLLPFRVSREFTMHIRVPEGFVQGLADCSSRSLKSGDGINGTVHSIFQRINANLSLTHVGFSPPQILGHL